MNEPIHQGAPAVDEDEINLLDLLEVISENIRLLVFGPLLVGLIALGATFLIKPTYTATMQILPPLQQQSGAAVMLQSLGALGVMAGTAGLKNPVDQFISLLKSDSVGNALIDRHKLIQRYDAKLRSSALKTLNASIMVTAGKDGLIKIEASDEDPVFAAQLANSMVDELSTLLNRLAVTEAQQRRQFFEKQLEQTNQKLIAAEQALQATGINREVFKSNPQTAVTASAQLQANISAQEIKLASMRSYFSETSPEIQRALQELAAMRAALSRTEKSVPVQADSNSDYVSKYREFKYRETLFDLFSKQFELAKVDESREGAVIQVVDAALPPDRKSKPKKAQIAILATLGTGFVLLLYVFIRQAWRRAQQNPQAAAQLRKIVGNLRPRRPGYR